MKRYKKVICLVLIFTLSLSLFAVPAGAVDPVSAGIVLANVIKVGSLIALSFDIANGAYEWYTNRFGSGTIQQNGSQGFTDDLYYREFALTEVGLVDRGVLISFETLSDLALSFNQIGISCTCKTTTFKGAGEVKTVWSILLTDQDVISQAGGISAGKYPLFTNPDGKLYYSPAATDNTTSTNTNYNYYTQEGSPTTNNEYNYNSGDTVNNPIFKYGDEVTENNQVYDYSSDSYVEVGDITYDASTKQYTTNITIDNSVHVQYNIDHTSITYIGSSAEDKTYNLYYELPDGRNSSELTAEDLEQLVLNYNVINYGVSADDGRLRALYHFDGDLEDSSYWSKYSKWDWISGASITYLESNAFGGSLYLDENAHQFSITLPSAFSTADFSVLFRYYHSADDSTNAGNDLVVSNGSSTLWTITAGTSTSSNVPVGQWTEVALIRDGTTLYCYVNGVVKASSSISGILGNALTFTFSSGATYRQLDELRVYNFATSEAGADYTPTAVPVDTNAVLILPDQATAVPDAYWEFNTEGNVLLYQDFTNGNVNPFLNSDSSVIGGYNSYSVYLTNVVYQAFDLYKGRILARTNSSPTVNSQFVSLYNYRIGSDSLTNIRYDIGFNYEAYSNTGNVCVYNFFPQIPVWKSYTDAGGTTFNTFLELDTDYTYSIVDVNGNVYSVPLRLASDGTWSDQFVEYDNLYLYYRGVRDRFGGYYHGYGAIYIIPKYQTTFEFVYQELVKGTTPNSGHNYVTEIYSDLDLTMPTVAIRSQISIREYRIGGVRPTVPYRGDVWMMVENSHITSVQIYTGFAWQEVDLRIWTGQRWVSALYYNIMTQQDYTDILGTTDNEYIQSTEGFYSWLTKQFKELLAILNEISDQLEDIDSGGGTSLDFTFEVVDITVEFTKLSDDGRDGLITITQPFYEVVFSELGTIYEGVLDDFSLLFSTSDETVTIDGETGYTFWYIFNAPEEVWNVRSVR